MSILGEIDNLHTFLFTPDSSRLLAWGGKAFRVWDIASREQILYSDINAFNFALHPHLPIIVSARSRDVGVYEMKGGELRRDNRYQFPKATALCLTFDDSGELLACATREEIAIWRWTSQGVHLQKSKQAKRATTLCFSPEGNLAFGDASSHFYVWDWRKDHIVYHTQLDSPAQQIKYSRQRYAIATPDAVYLDDAQKRESSIYPLELYANYHKSHVPTISGDHRYLAFFAANFQLLLFDLDAKSYR